MFKLKFEFIFIVVAIFGMMSYSPIHAAGITVPFGHTVNVNNSNWIITGDIINEGTLGANTGEIILDGDWSNYGTFNSSTGTVTLDSVSNTQSVQTGGVGSAFHVLDVLNSHSSGVVFTDTLYCDTLNATTGVQKLSFDTFGMHTIYSTFNVNGSTGNLITLAPVAASTNWSLDAPTSTVNFLSVSYSQEVAGNLITACNSVDGGNNTNWDFNCSGGAQPNLDYTLRESISFPLTSGTIVLKVGDMDGDGVLDIVTRNYSNRTISVLEINAGTFVNRFTFTEPSEMRSNIVAEVDGDGMPEILSANRSNGRVQIWEASGNNTYALRYTAQLGDFIEGVKVGDSDGDGKREFLVARESFPSHVYIIEAISNNVYVNQGSVTGPGGNNIFAGAYDLDADGMPEIVFADDGYTNTTRLYVYENGSIVFQDNQMTHDVPYLWNHGIGDTDGNGLGEIIGYKTGTNYLRILESTGSNNDFVEVFNAPDEIHRVLVKDVNNDGQAEFVQGVAPNNVNIATRMGSTITDIYDSGSLFHNFPGNIIHISAIGDTNGDGNLELAVGQGSVEQGYLLHILEQITVATTEDCTNGIDDDNDGLVDCFDSDCPDLPTTYYGDSDGDGYGVSTSQTQDCTQPTGGYAIVSGDCNDGDALVNPGAAEICDGIDNNCDGQIDEGVKTIFYKDADGDGYSDGTTITACVKPVGYKLASELTPGTDCNDADANEFPGQTWHKDADGDGYSDGITTSTCARPVGYKLASELTPGTDCNDANEMINPGITEACDGIDNDCDGQVDEGFDVDGDGFTTCNGDCDDSNAAINPGTTKDTLVNYTGNYVTAVNDYSTDPPTGDINVSAELKDTGSPPQYINGWEVVFEVYDSNDVLVASESAITVALGNAQTTINDVPVGVYTIKVVYTGDDCYYHSDEDSIVLAVYDPSAGFVTGGGWINSPAGAYKEPGYENVTGKANFGFVSKYKRGATVPTGQTEFVFKAADLNFHSSNYEWLVITGGGSSYSAQFKGTGTINGAGTTNGDYKFMVWAGDSTPDTFRIKIWEEIGIVETVQYDNKTNGTDQAIGGGSIKVHSN